MLPQKLSVLGWGSGDQMLPQRTKLGTLKIATDVLHHTVQRR